MRPWTHLLRYAALAGALVGGLGELAVLQRWRMREWLLRNRTERAQ